MRISTMRLVSTAGALGGALMALAAVAGPASAGVTGPAIYVDGVAYRTVGTPAGLPASAPAHSFDTIYSFSGVQRNVATAAPGDGDFNGGRWEVHGLSFPSGYAAALADADAAGVGNANGVIDSDAELDQALAAGTAVDDGVVTRFECPVIPLPRGR